MTIRRFPEDFRVEECLTPDFQASLAPLEPVDAPARPEGHPHAVYALEKTSFTTPEAASQLAAALHVRAGLVTYAGLKDKHAVTTQHVSIDWASLNREEPPAASFERERWNAKLVGWSTRALAADCIDCNRFSILVRGASRAEVGETRARARELAESPGSLLMINYFGDQRFGSARHGEGWIGLHLVRGEFEQALKLAIATPARKDTGKKRIFSRAAAKNWGNFKLLSKALPACPERAAIEALDGGASFRDAFAALPPFLQQMSIESYQSHLWNRIASRLATQGIDPKRIYTADDDFGPMPFPAAAALNKDWAGLDLPLPAPDAEPPAALMEAYRSVLAEDGVTLDRLKIPGLRRPSFGAAPRPMVVRATNFELGKAEPDETAAPKSPKNLKFIARFDLPRGSYATVLLRALGQ
jgi:tRNA pseudouridine13 synthase